MCSRLEKVKARRSYPMTRQAFCEKRRRSFEAFLGLRSIGVSGGHLGEIAQTLNKHNLVILKLRYFGYFIKQQGKC
jgi:hypothetical protein